jgi:methylated-DNA-[protein]-cysteine S-methyltransferase
MQRPPAQQVSLHTPVGDITVSALDDAIVALDWGWSSMHTPSPLLERARDWLNGFFDGDTDAPDLPLRPDGTNFQKRVWGVMTAIPAGRTRSYGELARELDSAAQAVGNACGANPIPILIPCHRVVGASGLGGYSGGDGLSTKTALLRLEGALL